ncbi:Hypothetical predicted protein [Olea europaea subsp. europaea]|uniref:Uncharacterized protein n=1 Tax=Olea europaea subsp. europaea TaxID=158383 RepID=A0A8S0PAL8_OLEEU|nr:Hypothetical predicted protein [Olea europaea subsp. europaea]
MEKIGKGRWLQSLLRLRASASASLCDSAWKVPLLLSAPANNMKRIFSRCYKCRGPPKVLTPTVKPEKSGTSG